jgi:serine/threonine protein phosphatase PrpC
MNSFQRKVEGWLSRSVPERAVLQAFDFPAVVLTTDVGLQRTENQDRVAALSFNALSGERLIAIAVVDGMGGMRDGAQCATLALASFFRGLLSFGGQPLQHRANQAVSFANEAVFRYANGKGGSTLSAIVTDGRANLCIVHVGDSRVYAFGKNGRVERLTKDDSLAEAVGGHGRELLQFVGMGPEMRAFLGPIDRETKNIAITSDGIHFVDQSTLQSILNNSSNVRSAAERLAALARWCGGPDNASAAFVDLHTLAQQDPPEDGVIAQIWDPFGSLSLVMRPEDFTLPSGLYQTPARQQTSEKSEIVPSNIESFKGPPPVQPRKNSKRKRKGTPLKKDIQLEIKIEGSNSGEDDGENSQ